MSRLFRRSRSSDHEEGRWVVVGLGNPGERYAKTRHNIGAMTIELLLDRAAARSKRHRSGCLIAEASLGGERVVIARTASFMNESGRPVGELVRWYKTDPHRLIVVHDELDIPFGEIRIKEGGGTAGHNGLGSLVSHLGTKDFMRVRVGIGRPRGSKEAGDHVLAAFSSSERKELEFVLNDAADAVERILEVGIERAMNEVNTRATP